MKPPQIKRKLFVQWLEKQPDTATFKYMDCDNCLIACYFREMHGIQVSVGGYSYRLINSSCDLSNYEEFPSWLDRWAVQKGCYDVKNLKIALNII